MRARSILRGAAPGFSLIEVVVAFVVLALGLGVLIGGLTTGLRGTARAAEAGYALMYAESLLSEAGVTEPLEVGEARGVIGNGHIWRRTIRPFPVAPAAGLSAYEVAVAITPPGGGASVTLVTLRLADAGRVPR